MPTCSGLAIAQSVAAASRTSWGREIIEEFRPCNALVGHPKSMFDGDARRSCVAKLNFGLATHSLAIPSPCSMGMPDVVAWQSSDRLLCLECKRRGKDRIYALTRANRCPARTISSFPTLARAKGFVQPRHSQSLGELGAARTRLEHSGRVVYSAISQTRRPSWKKKEGGTASNDGSENRRPSRREGGGKKSGRCLLRMGGHLGPPLPHR